MKRTLLTVCVCFAAAAAWAQTQATGGSPAGGSPMGGYNAMRIDAGLMKGNFNTGTINELTDGVKITLLSDDPNLKPIPIRAHTMTFNWAEGAKTPTTIIMDGNVEVQHPDASISAEHAEWNFKTGELVFTGQPVVNSDRMKGLTGEKMIINFEKNTFEVSKVRADEVPLQGAGVAAGDPSLFTDTDIKDWAGFITALKDAAKSDNPSPAKQLVGALDKDIQGVLASAPVDTLVQQKDALVKQLNKVLKRPGLYSQAAWKDIPLNDEVKGLLAKGKLTETEQTRQNRLLLEAAFPQFIVKR